MANWQQLKQYVHSNYVVSQDLDHTLKLEFANEGGRSQLVFLTYEALMGGSEGWVNVESPVGRTSEVDLRAALIAAGKLVCGGLGAAMADPEVLVLRHAVPLENLDINEFERPFKLLTATADKLELELTGEDNF